MTLSRINRNTQRAANKLANELSSLKGISSEVLKKPGINGETLFAIRNTERPDWGTAVIPLSLVSNRGLQHWQWGYTGEGQPVQEDIYPHINAYTDEQARSHFEGMSSSDIIRRRVTHAMQEWQFNSNNYSSFQDAIDKSLRGWVDKFDPNKASRQSPNLYDETTNRYSSRVTMDYLSPDGDGVPQSAAAIDVIKRDFARVLNQGVGNFGGGISVSFLRKFGYIFNKSGDLEPAGEVTGQIFGVGEAAVFQNAMLHPLATKANKLASTTPGMPAQIYGVGGWNPLQPTYQNIPATIGGGNNYIYSNVVNRPGEQNVPLYMMPAILGPTVIPGAVGVFRGNAVVRQGDERTPIGYFGNPKLHKFGLGIEDVRELVNANFDFDQGLIGQYLPTGRSNYGLGKVNNFETSYSKGVSGQYVKGYTVNLPEYYDPATGLGVGAKVDGAISTSGILAALQAKFQNINFTVGGNKLFGGLETVDETAMRFKGLDVKGQLLPLGEAPQTMIGGQKYRFQAMSSEFLKGPQAIGRMFFATRSWEQIQGVVQDWAGMQNTPEAAQFANLFSQRFAPTKAGRMSISLQSLTKMLRKSGMNYDNSVNWMNNVIKDVILNPNNLNNGRNATNIQRYGMGLTEQDMLADLGVVSRGNLKLIRNAQIREIMRLNPKLSAVEANGIFEQGFAYQDKHLYQRIQKGTPVGQVGAVLYGGYEAEAKLGDVIRRGLALSNPEVLDFLGKGYGMAEPNTHRAAILGMASFVSFQKGLMKGMDVAELQQLGHFNMISGEQAQRIAQLLENSGFQKGDPTGLLQQAAELMGDKAGMINLIQANGKTGFMPSLNDIITILGNSEEGKTNNPLGIKTLTTLAYIVNPSLRGEHSKGDRLSTYTSFMNRFFQKTELAKEMVSVESRSALGGNYSTLLGMEPADAYVTERQQQQLADQLRLQGEGRESLESLLFQGLPQVSGRYPVLDVGGLVHGLAWNRAGLSGVLDQRTLDFVENSPFFRGQLFAGYGLTVTNQADFDADQAFVQFLMKAKGDVLGAMEGWKTWSAEDILKVEKEQVSNPNIRLQINSLANTGIFTKDGKTGDVVQVTNEAVMESMKKGEAKSYIDVLNASIIASNATNATGVDYNAYQRVLMAGAISTANERAMLHGASAAQNIAIDVRGGMESLHGDPLAVALATMNFSQSYLGEWRMGFRNQEKASIFKVGGKSIIYYPGPQVSLDEAHWASRLYEHLAGAATSPMIMANGAKEYLHDSKWLANAFAPKGKVGELKKILDKALQTGGPQEVAFQLSNYVKRLGPLDEEGEKKLAQSIPILRGAIGAATSRAYEPEDWGRANEFEMTRFKSRAEWEKKMGPKLAHLFAGIGTAINMFKRGTPKVGGLTGGIPAVDEVNEARRSTRGIASGLSIEEQAINMGIADRIGGGSPTALERLVAASNKLKSQAIEASLKIRPSSLNNPFGKTLEAQGYSAKERAIRDVLVGMGVNVQTQQEIDPNAEQRDTQAIIRGNDIHYKWQENELADARSKGYYVRSGTLDEFGAFLLNKNEGATYVAAEMPLGNDPDKPMELFGTQVEGTADLVKLSRRNGKIDIAVYDMKPDHSQDPDYDPKQYAYQVNAYVRMVKETLIRQGEQIGDVTIGLALYNRDPNVSTSIAALPQNLNMQVLDEMDDQELQGRIFSTIATQADVVDAAIALSGHGQVKISEIKLAARGQLAPVDSLTHAQNQAAQKNYHVPVSSGAGGSGGGTGTTTAAPASSGGRKKKNAGVVVTSPGAAAAMNGIPMSETDKKKLAFYATQFARKWTTANSAGQSYADSIIEQIDLAMSKIVGASLGPDRLTNWGALGEQGWSQFAKDNPELWKTVRKMGSEGLSMAKAKVTGALATTDVGAQIIDSIPQDVRDLFSIMGGAPSSGREKSAKAGISITPEIAKAAEYEATFRKMIALTEEHKKSLKDVIPLMQNATSEEKARAQALASSKDLRKQFAPGTTRQMIQEQARLEQLQASSAALAAAGGAGGGTITPDQFAALPGGEEEAGRPSFSSMMRKLLGGWGLMYMKDIAGYIASGVGWGASEVEDYRTRQAQVAGAMMGSRVPYVSYNQRTATMMGLAGTDVGVGQLWNRIQARQSGIQMAGSSLFAGLAGAAGFGYLAQSGIFGGMAPEAIGAIAGPIGFAIGGGALLANIAGRASDVQGVANGLAGSRNGFGGWVSNIGSVLAQGWNMNFNPGKARQAAGMAYFQERANLPTEELLELGRQGVMTQSTGFKKVWSNTFGWQTKKDITVDWQYATPADVATIKGNAIAAQFGFSSEIANQVGSFYTMNPSITQTDRLTQSLAANYQYGNDPMQRFASMLTAGGYSTQRALGAGGLAARLTAALGGAPMGTPGITMDAQQAAIFQAGLGIMSNQPGAMYGRFGAFGASPLSANPSWQEALSYQNYISSYANLNPFQISGMTAANQASDMMRNFGFNVPFMEPGAAGGIRTQAQAFQMQTRANWLGSMWSGMMNGSPLAWSSMMQRAGGWGQAVNFGGLMTNWGAPISASILGMTDVGLNGQMTGLAWGTSSLAGAAPGQTPVNMASQIWGNFGPYNAQMYGNLGNLQAQFGQYGGGAINAMVNGVKVNGVTLAGQYGLQGWQNQQSYNFAMASAGLSMTSANASLAFATGIGINNYNNINPQTGKYFNIGAQSYGFNAGPYGSYQSVGGGAWGIEDAQRYLGYAQQQASFGFQQQGLNLQSQQFFQNMGLQYQGMQLERSRGMEEYGFNVGFSAQQFGFSQTMFRENARFTSGRERRLAEMQNRENVIEYNMQTEQRRKEFDYQQQSWKLQEDQYNTQIQQFQQTKQLQQEQLDANRLFWEENKKLTEAAVELQRAQFIENNKLQKESAGLAAAQATMQKQVNDALLIYNDYNDKLKGKLDSMDQTTLVNMLTSLRDLDPAMGTFISRLLELLNSIGGGGGGGGGTTTDPCRNITDPIEKARCYAEHSGSSGNTGGVAGSSVQGSGVSASSISQATSKVVIPMGSSSSSLGAPIIQVYIGSERLETLAVRAVQRDLGD